MDLEQLAVDQLRFGIAAGLEEQLAVLLEHLAARLGAEDLGELVASRFGLADAGVGDDIVAARLAGEVDLVLVAGLSRDLHHAAQKLHGVDEGALIEPAPGRLVERVGIDLVSGHFGGGAILVQRLGQFGLVEEMLTEKDVAGGRPGRARVLLHQLAGGGHRLLIAARVLEDVCEEEERLVQARRGGIFLQELAIARDGLGAHGGDGGAIAACRDLVALVGFGLGADGEGKTARSQHRREAGRHFRLFLRRTAQRKKAPQCLLLLLLLLRHDLLDVGVEQRLVAGGLLSDGGGDEENEHGPLPSLSGCNLRARQRRPADGGGVNDVSQAGNFLSHRRISGRARPPPWPAQVRPSPPAAAQAAHGGNAGRAGTGSCRARRASTRPGKAIPPRRP